MRQKAKFVLPTRFSVFNVDDQYWRDIERRLEIKFNFYSDIRMVNFNAIKVNGNYVVSFESEGRRFEDPEIPDENNFCYVDTFHALAHWLRDLFSCELLFIYENSRGEIHCFDTSQNETEILSSF